MHATVDDLQSVINVDEDILKWRLNVLEHGFCVEKDVEQGKLTYKLTQEGRVVDYMKCTLRCSSIHCSDLCSC